MPTHCISWARTPFEALVNRRSFWWRAVVGLLLLSCNLFLQAVQLFICCCGSAQPLMCAGLIASRQRLMTSKQN